MIKFASRMSLLTGSEIRELLKLTARPEVISFAGGMPAMELFPVDKILRTRSSTPNSSPSFHPIVKEFS